MRIAVLIVPVLLAASQNFPLKAEATRASARVDDVNVNAGTARTWDGPDDFRREAQATARGREESVQSSALGRTMKYRVLLPEAYARTLRRYPVLYLLHGLGGDYTDWTSRTNVAKYGRQLGLIIVMPTAETSGSRMQRMAPPHTRTMCSTICPQTWRRSCAR